MPPSDAEPPALTDRQFVHREIIILAVLCGIAAGAFLVTRAVAASTREVRRRDAADWSVMAQQSLGEGQVSRAVDALRRAVAKDPINREHRLALAHALAVAHRDDQAKEVLAGLREVQPEDPETNLQLARLEARDSDPALARRYYQNALNALWTPDQTEARARIREELIQFLLRHNERSRALSELLTYSAGLPEDSRAQTLAGRLFLEAGDARRAREHFLLALRADPTNQDALAGAGEAAFEAGDFAEARRYLHAVTAADERVREHRTIADLVLSADPLARRVSGEERQRRLSAAVAQATEALNACLAAPAAAGHQPSAALEPLRVEAQSFILEPPSSSAEGSRDRIEAGLDLVYRVEQAVEQSCGAQTPFDRALLLIGRRYHDQ